MTTREADREWAWSNATGCASPDDANALLLKQSAEIARLRERAESAEALLANADATTATAVDRERVARADMAGLHLELERCVNALGTRGTKRLDAETRARVALTDPHPGTALLEEMRRDKEGIKALAAALERGLRGMDPFKACFISRGIDKPCACFQCEMRSALRLAGVLP